VKVFYISGESYRDRSEWTRSHLHFKVLRKAGVLPQVAVNLSRLGKEKQVKVLEVARALANVFQIAEGGMISVEVDVFSISFFARKEERNS
jgi:hypothetical protein